MLEWLPRFFDDLHQANRDTHLILAFVALALVLVMVVRVRARRDRERSRDPGRESTPSDPRDMTS